jgi:hypothetical protein
MIVGQGPNWGCSAKGKKKKGSVSDVNYRILFLHNNWTTYDL